MNKRNNRKNKNKKTLVESRRTVAQFNLSKILFVIVIIAVLVTVSTVSVITIDAHKKNVLASEETGKNVTWVESSDLDDDGNPIKVPVPKGYTASQIPGETSAKNGFVIYEGDIDWNTILTDETTTETVIETMSNEDTTSIKENNNEEIVENNDENIEQSEEQETSENEVVEENETEQNEVAEENLENTENIENSEENQEENIDEEQKNPIEENVVEEQTEQEVQNENEISNEITEDENTENQETTDETKSAENGIEPLAEEDEEITQEDINIFNLQKSVNQYVWVPVSNPSRIYGTDSNGKLWGKLYNFNSNGRTALNWSETDGIMKINSLTSNREPDVMHNNTAYEIDSSLQSNQDGKTQYSFLSRELEETFSQTIASIVKYGGFYIGRYETGGLNNKAVVRRMETELGTHSWYTMYEKCKNLNNNNDYIITSMIWGCLWDETMNWLVESKATISDTSILTYSTLSTNSIKFGNHANSSFKYIEAESEIPKETLTKDKIIEIPTGSSEYTKVNNIYDLTGNVYDGTLEITSSRKIYRGGGYYDSYSVLNRNGGDPNGGGIYWTGVNYGCRVILLIK